MRLTHVTLATHALLSQLKDGSWRKVPVTEGAVLVNLGTLATVLSNGKWKSTMHRVVNPSKEDAPNSRRRSGEALVESKSCQCVKR